LTELPELAQTLPQKLEPDEAAAIHYRIFSYDIFPFESIYRDPSGLLGGTFAEEVRLFYQTAEVHLLKDEDHIGQELTFLAVLCEREANALRKHDSKAATRFAHLQYTFLKDHLLCWLPPFVNALSFSDNRFYVALGQMTLDLVYDHWLSLRHLRLIPSVEHLFNNATPNFAELVQDKDTDLNQIIHSLITPPLSGLYLGREAIAGLARKCQLPRGFGTRQQMLSNLFHSAAQYQIIPALLQAILGISQSWGHLYRQQMDSFPDINFHVGTWTRLVDQTTNGITSMQERSTKLILSL
jgi:TorA maturation chaperone TorD